MVVIFNGVTAQNLRRVQAKKDYSPNKNLEKANRFFDEGLYHEAAKYFELAAEDLPGRRDIYYKAGESYRKIRDYSAAAEKYKHLVDLNEKRYPGASYWLAHMQKAQGQYDDAKKSFEYFIKEITLKSTDKLYKAKAQESAKKELEKIEQLKTMKANPIQSDIRALSEINKENADFAAVTNNEGDLLFTGVSEEKFEKNIEISDRSTGKIESIHVNRLFTASKTESSWGDRVLVNIPLDPVTISIGAPAYSLDNNTIYLTYCNSDGKTQTCNIYASKKVDETWGTPSLLSINQSGYSTKHPSISKVDDKEILFFSSNRKGNVGGYDIWYSEIKSGKFSKPKHLGKKINSELDEISPFYDSEKNTLYFSSTGYVGLGEYDIFKIEGTPLVATSWDTLLHMGYPINSSADDYYYYLDREREIGFLSSNRSGSLSVGDFNCCDDIYTFSVIDGDTTQSEKKKEPAIAEVVIVDTTRPEEKIAEEVKQEQTKEEQSKPTQKEVKKTPPPVKSNLSTALKEFGDQVIANNITTADYQDFLSTYGQVSEANIVYKVQLGAFKKNHDNDFKHLQGIGEITKTKVGDYTKYITGNFQKLDNAEVTRKKVVNQGILDTFIAAYDGNQRIAILAPPKINNK